MRYSARVGTATLVVSLAMMPTAGEAQWRTTLLPVIGAAPETGGQFGVALFRTRQAVDTLGTRPSSLIGNAIFTSKSQQRAFVELDRWTAGNEKRLQVLAIASRFPLPFYGYGDDSPDIALPYEPTTFELSVTGFRKSRSSTWRYIGARTVVTDVEAPRVNLPDPFCDSLGCTPGGICDCGPSESGYRLASATLGRITDTRDNLFAPTSGRVFDMSVTPGVVWRPDGYESRNLLLRLRLDLRGYHRLRGGSVLAGQFQALASAGSFPLDQVVLVGHHTLNRGYTMGRYRDLDMLASQVEWRSPTRAWNNRLGFAAFSGVAMISGWKEYSRLLPSAGAGLRFRMDPRTRSTIRVDYARGVSGQSGLYVAFNEAF